VAGGERTETVDDRKWKGPFPSPRPSISYRILREEKEGRALLVLLVRFAERIPRVQSLSRARVESHDNVE